MTPEVGNGADQATKLLVFGGTRLLRGRLEVDLGPTRQREVLAILLAARGEVVTLDHLIEGLWADAPPASAVNQIQRHVGELRRLIEPGLPPRSAGAYLHSNGIGYRLVTHDLYSDLSDFYSRIDSRASSSAPTHLLKALEIAVLPPFPELRWELRSDPLFTSIDRDRWSTASDLMRNAVDPAEAELVLPIVERIAGEAPLDEGLQALLMKLLARVGRRAQALSLFDQTRRLLADKLGVDPSSELLAAHKEVLMGDRASEPAGQASPDAPHALPNDIASFVPRLDLVPVLDDVSQAAVDGQGGIAILSGMAGVGKTTLAVHWARSLAANFPDGQLYVNLRGFDETHPASEPNRAISVLLEQLGSDSLSESEPARIVQYQDLIGGKRILLLVDNARDADQVRPLLPASSHCLTIVTSRNALSGLVVREGARSIPLRRWNTSESRQLLVGRLGQARVDATPEAMASIIESCAGLPLALAIAAARTGLHPEASTSSLAKELADRARTLDSLTVGAHDSVRSTFEWSYRALPVETARLFRLFAVHPGPRMSVASLASASARTIAQTRALVSELATANMAIEIEDGHVELHDLMRVYALELLEKDSEAAAARRRLFEHYVWSGRDAFLQFGRSPTVDLLLGDDPPATIERFDSIQATYDWYQRERAVLKALIRTAPEFGMDRYGALIALDCRPMNQTFDSASDLVDSCRSALDSARRVAEPVLIGDLARDVGMKLSALGDPAGASAHLAEALACFESVHDAAGEANTYRNLSQHVGKYEGEAAGLEIARLGVKAARKTNEPSIIALALDIVAWMIPADADPNEQLEVFKESLSITEKAGLDYLSLQTRAAIAMNHANRNEFIEAREWAFTVPLDDEDPIIHYSVCAIIAWASMHLGYREEVKDAIDRHDAIWAVHEVTIREAYGTDDEMRWVEESRAWLAREGPE